jgi:hypothetical protein
MNIVKFRDIYLTPDIWELSGETCPYTNEDMDWFNENLKGKYAYALNWKWVVPFSEMNVTEFVEHSRMDSPGESSNCEWSKFEEYIDQEFTEKANSIEKYAALNKYSSGTEITLDDAKKFRTWLAETLLSIKDEESMERGEKQMLQYYAGGMYDSTIDSLSMFSAVDTQFSTVATSTCGCSSVNSGSLLTVGSTCDPIAIYRRGVYDLMVRLWSDHHYWVDLESDDFLAEFKLYIDAIVSFNLPLYIVDWTNVFTDCTCANSSDALQSAGIGALKNLSRSLQYIIDGDIKGHKNFIDSSFRVFASQYYERMYWI